MAEVASAFVSLMPSARGFGRQVDSQIGGDLEKSGKAGGKRFGGAFKSVVGPAIALAVGALAVTVLKDSIGEASDLSESINAVSVSYGKAAKDVLELGKNSATSFGLSKSEFNGLAVQFQSFAKTIAGGGGDVAKTLESIVGRATDFASVMNLDVADATALFQSGLAGETEPLRKYGLDLSAAAVEAYALSSGLVKNKGDLTEAAKVQARYGLLMKLTSKTQGDFANTSDGLANQQRILSAEFKDIQASIGTALLPVLARAATLINSKVIPALKVSIAFLKTNPGIIYGFGAALGVLAAGFVAVQVAAFAIPLAIAAAVAGLVYAYTKFETFRLVVDSVFTAIKAAVAVAMPYVKNIIQGAVDQILGIIKVFKGIFTGDWSAVWSGVKQILRGALTVIKTVLKAQLDAAVAIVKGIGSLLKSAAGAAFGKLKDGAQAGWAKTKEYVKDIPGKVVDAIGDLGGLLVNAGKELMSGLADGIKKGLGKVKDAAGSVAGSVKGFFPGSPVKEGPLTSWNNGGAGKRLIDMGLIDGIISRKGAVDSAMADLASGVDLNKSVRVPVGARFSGSSATSAAGRTTSPVTQHIYPQPGQSETEIGRAAANRLMWAMS